MISLPDSGWVRALLDLKPAGALVLAVGLGVLAGFGLVPEWSRPLLLVAAVVYLAPPANWLFECVEAWRGAGQQLKRQREVLAHLNDLGPKETSILADCLSEKRAIVQHQHARHNGNQSSRKGIGNCASVGPPSRLAPHHPRLRLAGAQAALRGDPWTS
jgi:hypothetical protein